MFQVNETKLVDAEHHLAVDALRRCGNHIIMVVAREVLVRDSHVSVGDVHAQLGSCNLQYCTTNSAWPV